MSTTTPPCKHSTCLNSLLLYKVQGFDVSVHAGIYATGWHHLLDAYTLQAGMHTLVWDREAHR